MSQRYEECIGYIYALCDEIGVSKDIVDYILKNSSIFIQNRNTKPDKLKKLLELYGAQRYYRTFLLITNLLLDQKETGSIRLMDAINQDSGEALNNSINKVMIYLTDGQDHVRDIFTEFPDLYASARIIKFMIIMPYVTGRNFDACKPMAFRNDKAVNIIRMVSDYLDEYCFPLIPGNNNQLKS